MKIHGLGQRIWLKIPIVRRRNELRAELAIARQQVAALQWELTTTRQQVSLLQEELTIAPQQVLQEDLLTVQRQLTSVRR